VPSNGSVAWFQIGTDDPEGAKRFYGNLLGWTFGNDPEDGPGYHLITTPGADKPAGGIIDTEGNAPNHAIFYAVVADVAAAAAEAERLGGKILVPPTTQPSGLVFTHLLDPSGNHFGVFSEPDRARQ
jgi:predicted enzyme related to lactoylglutathione lyase